MILSPKYPINYRLLKVAGYLGFFSHFSYYLTWVYLIPQPYDSLWLRLSCCLVSVPLMLVNYWPQRIDCWLHLYWHFFLMYVLTITCTYLTLQNNFSTMWMMTQVMALFTLSILIDEIILLFANLLIGVFVATLIFFINTPTDFLIIDSASFALIPVILACSVLFNFTKKKAIAAQEKAKTLKSLAGSIAHEMRNPLSQIYGTLYFLGSQLPTLDKQSRDYINAASETAKNGLQVIDITMDAIKEKPVDPSKFIVLSARDIVEESVADFAYSDTEHAEKVSVAGSDFALLADPILVKYLLYNLIGNALYYVKVLHDAEIVISLLPNCNQIEVRDTGPGIAPEEVPKLFDSFYTTGKQGGTGLGLAYCKRTMKALGGDIHCESELGKYTAFILSFPEISVQKMKKVTTERDPPPSSRTGLRITNDKENCTGS
jgi:two-component system CAI-1 autoinducer sensor kinase/phosphatase CqsS